MTVCILNLLASWISIFLELPPTRGFDRIQDKIKLIVFAHILLVTIPGFYKFNFRIFHLVLLAIVPVM
jgi:hypothetical protein